MTGCQCPSWRVRTCLTSTAQRVGKVYSRRRSYDMAPLRCIACPAVYPRSALAPKRSMPVALQIGLQVAVRGIRQLTDITQHLASPTTASSTPGSPRHKPKGRGASRQRAGQTPSVSTGTSRPTVLGAGAGPLQLGGWLMSETAEEV